MSDLPMPTPPTSLELDQFLTTIDPMCHGLTITKKNHLTIGFDPDDPEQTVAIFCAGDHFKEKFTLSRLYPHAENYSPTSNWHQCGLLLHHFRVGLLEPTDQKPLWTARYTHQGITHFAEASDARVAACLSLYLAHHTPL